MIEEVEIESPCVRECFVHQATGYCTGCFRTLKEIAYWAGYTPEEQRCIVALIEARRAAHASRLPGS
jgi:predicted Fe-S protein YdhL (DUF1289 family)